MAKLYVTGPALIYVGVPVQVAQLLAVPPVNQAELRAVNDPAFFRQGAAPAAAPAGPAVDDDFQLVRNPLLPKDVDLAAARGQLDNQMGQFGQPPRAGVIDNQGPESAFIGRVLRSFAPVFLGTAEVSPDVEITPKYNPVYRNESGLQVPFDWIYDGESGLIVADLTRYNEEVYAHLASRAAPPGRHVRGTDFVGQIGTAMVSEGIAYPLWLVFPYAPKLAFRGMPGGYRFVASFLLGPDRLNPLSTKPRKIRLVWYASRLYDQATGTHVLYDHILSSLPAPN